jgi:hypothetical protein
MGEIKTRLLLFLPFVLLVFAEVRKHSNRFLRVSVGMMVSFLLVALIFGGRLGGHHFVPLLVLSYLASAIGVFQTLGPLKLGCNAYFRCAPIGVMAAALIVQSVWGQLETRAKLRETGGVALFSDAINRFAESLSKRNFSGYVVTPDWGLYMPIIFLTGGKFHVVTELDTNHARKLLCNGTDLLYSLVVPDRKARVDELALNLDWDQFTIEAFRQRNGPVVFEVATFWGDRKSVKCISRATH